MGLTRIRAEQISDIDYKQAVRVITLTDITLSGGAPAEVDGVSLSTGNRVLVAGQDAGAENGLYVVETVGAGSNGTWVRSQDGNQQGEITAGMIVMVTEGAVFKDTQWKLITNDPIVLDVSDLIFEQNSAFAFGNIFANGTAVLANTVGDTVTFTAGDNISITGNASAKSVNFAVTGISLNSISNGTSNVTVVSSGGNVTVGVAGSEVAEFSTVGMDVTGALTASGNITGGNLVSASLGSAGNTAIIGTNNALTSTSSLFVDTANNRIGVGTVTPERTFDLVGNAAFTGDVQITQFNNSSDSGGIRIRKSRGADNAPSAVVDADTVGSIEFFLRDTSGFQQRASITSVVQVSGATYGADLAFATGNGAGPTTRLYIAEGGAITFNSAYTFPTSDGSANNALVTNGAGVLSFTGTPTFTSITATGNVTGGNLITAGLISATGNVTGGNILGNGAGLTGINVFSNVTIDGGNSMVASSISDTLTLVAGTGIVLLGNSASDTITIAVSGTGDSIFSTGGQMGLVTEAVVSSEDLALITDAVTESYDLGSIVTAGVIYPDLLFIGDIADLFILGGTNGQYLGTSGNGVMQWQTLDSAPLLGNLAGNIAGNGFSILDLATFTVTGNITGGNLSVSTGTVSVGNIVNTNSNGVGNIGSESTYFNTVFAKATSAQYADLAERYVADKDYEPGTVVVFGGDREVTTSQIKGDSRVAGVVSTNPSFIMNSGLEGEHVVTVALVGRVPTRVNGPISKGDLIVSDINGRACACSHPGFGTVIGKSLEDFDGDTGIVEVVIGSR
jgi:hypothetical protein